MRLEDSHLDTLFPFRIGVDRGGFICSTGPSLSKLLTGLEGTRILDEFRVIEPARCPDWNLERLCGELVILEHLNAKIHLKGQIIETPDQESLFACTPWLTSLDDLSELGLKFSDFPPHQGLSDFLFILNAHEESALQSKRLSEKLADKNRALAYRERLFGSLLEHLPSGGAMVVRQDGTVLVAAGTDLPCRQIREVGEEGGVPLEDLFGERASEIRKYLGGVDDQLGSRFDFQTGESTYRCAVSYSMHPKSHRSRWLVIFQNVTQDLRNQVQAERLQRLDSVGILAGGIAHDFNNYLSSILGNIALAREESDLIDVALTDAEEACHNASQLTRQLLTFSKGGDPIRAIGDLFATVEKAVRFTLSGSDIAFNVEKSDQNAIYLASFDAGQVTQVISNLCVNAKQAMDGSGSLRVQLEHVVVQDEADNLEPGCYVAISIADTGSGIPLDVLPQIWNPYFTTKSDGSGLGLATCHSIAKSHGGAMTVESVDGEGTTFRMWLPATHEAPRQLVENRDQRLPQGLRLLLMDDQPAIRMVGRRIFERMGQQVTTVEHGAEAVEHYESAQQSGCPFDLVVLDMTIPGGMGGEVTMARIRELDPDSYGVVCSGYSEANNLQFYQDIGFDAILPKPFTPENARSMLLDWEKRQQLIYS